MFYIYKLRNFKNCKVIFACFKSNFRLVFYLLFFSTSIFCQVGINTTTPQQELHIASNSGTIRIEGLDYINNSFNGGDVNGDLDLTNDTFPLYVDENGNLTLEFVPFLISDGGDAIDDTLLPTTTATLLSSDTDGEVTTEIINYTITTQRAAILEVKYNLSFDVYSNNTLTAITDNLARRISSYLTIDGDTREYGIVSRSYSSGSLFSAKTDLYNTCTAYINLPAAGTYTLRLFGEVSSGIKGSGPGTTSKATYVEFATGTDSMFIRLH